MSNQTVYFNNPKDIQNLQNPQSKYATTGTQVVTCGGTDSNNSRYLPSNSDYFDKYGIPAYGVFNVEKFPIAGNGQTFSGVCDTNYVYFPFEIAADLSTISGAYWAGWNITGKYNWMNNSTCVFLKVDRKTGKIVLAKPMSDITGIPTTDISSLLTTGDDITRGPFAIYNDHIYVTGQSLKYPSIIKVRCSDFGLVWRKVVPEGNRNINVPGHPELSISGIQMRQIFVVPPKAGVTTGIRSKPMVIAAATSGLEYGSLSYDTILKIFDYYQDSGRVWAYTDDGADATQVWSFLNSATPYQTGDLLSVNSFKLDNSGNPVDGYRIYYPLKNGTTFTNGNSVSGQEAVFAGTARNDPGSGVFLSGNLFYKVTNVNGNIVTIYLPPTLDIPTATPIKLAIPSSISANPNMVSSYGNLVGGVVYYVRQLTASTYQLHPTATDATNNTNVLVPGALANIIFSDYSRLNTTICGTWEMLEINFGIGSTFNSSATYTGTYTNVFAQGYTGVSGPIVQTLQQIATPVQVSGSILVGQPIVKKLWLSQVGVKVLDKEEAFELSCQGGGFYGNITYDAVADSIILGAGNCMHLPLEEELLLLETIRPTVKYPLVNGNLEWQYELGVKHADYPGLPLNTNFIANLKSDVNARNAYQAIIVNRWNTLDNYTTNNYSPNHQRCLYDSVMCFDVQTGNLLWTHRTNGPDIMDHSITFGGYQAQVSLFHANSINNDSMHGAQIITSGGKKYIITANKSRIFILDYTAAYATTLTHVSGDNSGQFIKGIKSGSILNTNSTVVKFKDTSRVFAAITSFNGLNTDGTWLIHRQANVSYTDAQVFDIGIEQNTALTVLNTNIPTIYGYNIADLLSGAKTKYSWAFVMDRVLGSYDVGCSQLYGDLVIGGGKTGELYFLDKTSGKKVWQFTNPSGSSVGPLIADGVMYMYGGNNKWNGVGPIKFAKELIMLTPFGQ